MVSYYRSRTRLLLVITTVLLLLNNITLSHANDDYDYDYDDDDDFDNDEEVGHEMAAPPSAWMQQQQASSCADLVKATVIIVNDSKTRFDVFWTNRKTMELEQINPEPIEYRQVTPYNSYVDQMMELHEIPNEDTGECGGSSVDQVCRIAFAKIKSDVLIENVVHLTPKFKTHTETNELRARSYTGEQIDSTITIQNRSGKALDVYWVSHKGEKSNLLTLQDHQDQLLNSFVNNEFEMVEVGDCVDECKMVRVHNHGNNPIITIDAVFNAMMGDENIALDE